MCDELDIAFDEDEPVAQQMGGQQFSVWEIFFATTLVAVCIWLYSTVGLLLSSILASFPVFVAIMKSVGGRSMPVGGVIGFAVAGVLAVLLCALNDLNVGLGAPLVLVYVTLGYTLGGAMTAWVDEMYD